MKAKTAIVSAFVTVFALFVSQPAQAQRPRPSQGDPLTFVLLPDGTYSVSASNQSISGAVVIPATYEGKNVTAFHGNAFRGCAGITGVTIPASIGNIASGAFQDCTNLTSVTLGTSRVLPNAFPGDFVNKYQAGGPGTYTRSPGSNTWTKQQSAQQPVQPQPQPADPVQDAARQRYRATLGTDQYDIFNITNTSQWTGALETIKRRSAYNFVLNITGDIGIPGTPPHRFVSRGQAYETGEPMGSTYYPPFGNNGHSVLITGNGRLYLTSQGEILLITVPRQRVIIDGEGLVLEGLRAGLNGSSVDNNKSAILLSSGTLELRNGTIRNNSGTGSGVEIRWLGDTQGGGRFTMTGGTVTGNANSIIGGPGGGVNVQSGTFTMSGGTISNNSASFGGGVAIWNGAEPFSMTGGTITGNRAVYNSGNSSSGTGGGVYIFANTFNMTGGTISANTAKIGGGLYVYFTRGISIAGGVIYGGNAPEAQRNTATDGNTWGHAALYNHISDESGRLIANYYRDLTVNANETLPMSPLTNTPFIPNAGGTKDGWTRR